MCEKGKGTEGKLSGRGEKRQEKRNDEKNRGKPRKEGDAGTPMASHLLSASGLCLRAVQTSGSLNWDPERQRSYQPLSSLEVHSWKRTGGFPTTGQAFSSMRKPLLCLWPLDDGQLECLEWLLKTPNPALHLLPLRFRASVTLAREFVE